eukprot:gnl/TRDRNA2_/TRDRNA2_63760_c0_seq1.p1 gnl/TRDRNA2_/TRDRNA2_63760_c0~~gnl/TRDRNA2_/TRDRNA2_63760_c0_seq1.p1  ORF type:complete len:128 (+),score=20.98 gnl/TRDRNA2_/TRDRNA2_63760_c0_seq1:2-385(+)
MKHNDQYQAVCIRCERIERIKKAQNEAFGGSALNTSKQSTSSSIMSSATINAMMAAKTGQRELGKVSQWHAEKGFGFIKPDEGSGELVFDSSTIDRDNDPDWSVAEGAIVTFIKYQFKALKVRLHRG